METLKGDFIGFEFNGIHSSELGIIRTSNGSRFNTNLLPTIVDKVAQVNGRDGAYFFGSSYNQKQFNIPIASDNMTEEQFFRLSKVFGDKEIHSLIFDETPYKKYLAKITGSPTFNFICFDENGKRIYKGEGAITLTAYYPFAKSVHKFLDQYDINEELIESSNNDLSTNILNDAGYVKNNSGRGQWVDASRLKDTQDDYDLYIGNIIKLYNAGDLETDYRLYIKFNDQNTIPAFILQLIPGNDVTDTSKILKINEIAKQGDDTHICINCELGLIEGIVESNNKYLKTGKVYNKYIRSGLINKIPPYKENYDYSMLIMSESGLRLDNEINIEYDYLYY